MALPEMQHASDSKHCRRCGAPYVYDAIYLGHLGVYRCPNCGQRRPEPDGQPPSRSPSTAPAAPASRCARPRAARAVELPLPGLYNVYNALAAAALCLELGRRTRRTSSTGLEAVTAAFGRAERVAIGDVELSILLVKNPAGANEILRTLALERARARRAGRAQRPDRRRHATSRGSGTPTSSCWPTRPPRHLRRHPRRRAGAAPEVRRRPADRLPVVPGLAGALDGALASAAGGRLFALPTYTALLELRDELARRGSRGPVLGAGRRRCQR